MPNYLLVLRDRMNGNEPPSDEELQSIFKRFGEWKDGLVASGKLRGGEKLVDGRGAVVFADSSMVNTTMRPYESSHEVLSGFFLIEADSLEAASEVASGCPQVDFGSVEIREIEQMEHQ